MKSLLISLLCTCFMLVPLTMCAQEYKITGTLRDLITENGVDSVKVELLRDDSCQVDTAISEIPFTEEEIAEEERIMEEARFAKETATETIGEETTEETEGAQEEVSEDTKEEKAEEADASDEI